MKAKQIWANLVVEDLNRTAEFYNRLGFTPNGKGSNELVSFFFAENNFVIHFFIREKLESAMGRKAADLKHGTEIMFSLSAESKQEVDEWATKAKDAGGSIFREPSEDENGYYYCGFADPDGHMFNVLLVTANM